MIRYHVVQEFNKGVYDYIIATDEGGKIEMDDPDVEAPEKDAQAAVVIEEEEDAGDDDCKYCYAIHVQLVLIFQQSFRLNGSLRLARLHHRLHPAPPPRSANVPRRLLANAHASGNRERPTMNMASRAV